MNILEALSPSKYEKKIVKVPLNVIDKSINVNPRSTLVMETVENLIEAGDFPEIHLGYLDGKLIIVDGYHREVAAEKLNQEEISAYITEYKTLADLKRDAFKENVNHGVKLTEFDVARWIYDNFLEECKLVPSTSLSVFVKKCDVRERRALTLFRWYVVHKEVLEDNEIEPRGTTGTAEELYTIITFFKEIPGYIKEDFKIQFKQFYNKYVLGGLDRYELRKAIAWFKEGKDYDEEKAREKRELEESAKIVEEMEKADLQAWNDSIEHIDPTDEIDRTGNADYCSRDIENSHNETIANLIEESEELQQEIKEEVKKDNEKDDKLIVSKLIDNIGKHIMSLNMLSAKKKEVFTYEHLALLEDIMSRTQDIIDNLDPNELRAKQLENNLNDI